MAATTANFDAGIEQAVARVLADPRFVFRFEREPANVPPGRAYRVSDIELASRLSFFLWSSIPDDELLGVAACRTNCTNPRCSNRKLAACSPIRNRNRW